MNPTFLLNLACFLPWLIILKASFLQPRIVISFYKGEAVLCMSCT